MRRSDARAILHIDMDAFMRPWKSAIAPNSKAGR